MPALPSSRPPNPSSFRVATSSTPRSHTLDSADLLNFQSSSLSRALSTAGPSSLALKLSWIERLTNPEGVGLEELRSAAGVLDRASWDDLVEERWMEGRCPYPTCSRPAGEAYRPAEDRERDMKRLKVRMRASGLYEAPRKKEGNGAYCSVECRARSEWFKGLVGSGRSAVGEMLEDVEERRKEVALSTEKLVRQAEEAKVRVEGGVKGKGKEDEATPLKRKTDDFRQELLSSLTIRENHPESTAAPLPPSADAAVQDFERPRRAEPSSSSSSSSARSTRFPASPALRPGSSTTTTTSSSSASLLPFSASRLSTSVLSSLPSTPSSSSRGPNGLPPIRFLGAPRTLDDDNVGLEEEEESEEVRRMIEEGLWERNEARRRGEIR